MTKREKTLGVSFLLVILAIVLVLAASFIKKQRAGQVEKLNGLKANVYTYSMMEDSAHLIDEEVSWVNKHSPSVISFEDAQTDLQNFLVSSSRRLGFSPYSQELIKRQDTDEANAIYQRVKIQISARATERQIYQWLVGIHQPKKMRILSYLRLSPPINDSNLINCQIIAEQYIVAK